MADAGAPKLAYSYEDGALLPPTCSPEARFCFQHAHPRLARALACSKYAPKQPLRVYFGCLRPSKSPIFLRINNDSRKCYVFAPGPCLDFKKLSKVDPRGSQRRPKSSPRVPKELPKGPSETPRTLPRAPQEAARAPRMLKTCSCMLEAGSQAASQVYFGCLRPSKIIAYCILRSPLDCCSSGLID